MRVRELLLLQAGIISREQALGCGLSASSIRRRVARGEWRDVHPGVLLDVGHPLGDRARIVAAALWGGPDAVLDGPSAAFWSGLLPRAPVPVGVTVPPRVRRRVPPGIRLRRRDLPRADRIVLDGVALTAVPLTVLETCAVLPDGAAFLDRALQRRRVGPADLHRAYCRNAGAHGMATAHRLLVAALDRADSRLERSLLRLLRSEGIGGFVRGLPVGDGREIDIAFPVERVAIELDGWAWHVDPARFAADRAKGNALVGAGWILLRFTWRDVTRHPDRTIAAVRRALGR
ncbi:DUF559 domain-containing protein [Pseudonocardia sp. NPDC046786]|uniref:type IV toxin-antitoxin system AbiEi family antitoxin domain-containing protein n=1 Tax=Pseudonocardia sp. NPDC046786 TaxID=3155471 RepID=UPI0033E854D8